MVSFSVEVQPKDPQIQTLSTNYYSTTPIITDLRSYTQFTVTFTSELVTRYNLPIAQSGLLSDACSHGSEIVNSALLLTGVVNHCPVAGSFWQTRSLLSN
jgi:hypothetical protein